MVRIGGVSVTHCGYSDDPGGKTHYREGRLAERLRVGFVNGDRVTVAAGVGSVCQGGRIRRFSESQGLAGVTSGVISGRGSRRSACRYLVVQRYCRIRSCAPMGSHGRFRQSGDRNLRERADLGDNKDDQGSLPVGEGLKTATGVGSG